MRSGFLLRGVLGAAIAGLAFAVLAQPAGALEISKHAKDSAETNAVQLKGKIEDGDTYELQVYIAGLAKKPNVVVYLNSAGGNLREGMRLGRFFFQNKIETVIESKTQCASACALAFLGGRDDAGGGQSNGFTPRSDVPANTDDFQPVSTGGGGRPADDDIPF